MSDWEPVERLAEAGAVCHACGEPMVRYGKYCAECDDEDGQDDRSTWACSRYGGYGHDWLDCPDCVSSYEAALDKSSEGPEVVLDI